MYPLMYEIFLFEEKVDINGSGTVICIGLGGRSILKEVTSRTGWCSSWRGTSAAKLEDILRESYDPCNDLNKNAWFRASYKDEDARHCWASLQSEYSQSLQRPKEGQVAFMSWQAERASGEWFETVVNLLRLLESSQVCKQLDLRSSLASTQRFLCMRWLYLEQHEDLMTLNAYNYTHKYIYIHIISDIYIYT